jgi:malonyl CoA-acyl carrier protein transacylase
MRGRGVTTFIELGAKDVLTGLLKRIDKEAVGIPAADPAGIQAAITA